MKMLMHVTLPPLGPFSPDSRIAPLVFMLEGMIDVNRHHIRQSRDRFKAGLGPPVPPLYLSGIWCARGRQRPLADLLQCMVDGAGDRESLSVWRCAELREAGMDAHPVISRSDDGRIACSVRLPDGTIEDVSQKLGAPHTSPNTGRVYDDGGSSDQIKRTLVATLPPLGPYSPESHFAPLVFMLEGMIKVNRHHIRQARDRARAGMGPTVPSLYHSGVRYQKIRPGKKTGAIFTTVCKMDTPTVIGSRSGAAPSSKKRASTRIR